jgi:DNA sulfur modification protein DndE
MNIEFKNQVWRSGFRPTTFTEDFEDELRAKLGFTSKYESARLSFGRSLAEPTQPQPVKNNSDEKGKPISGELLFGEDIDLWIAIFVMDGELGENATIDNFRNIVEAHWKRGAELLKIDFEDCEKDEIRFISRLAELLPVMNGNTIFPVSNSVSGEIRLKVGSISKTYPDEIETNFCINGPGTAPHIALMGKNGSGKTTTGVQIAIEIVKTAGIPLLFIDPKGEFADADKPLGALGEGISGIKAIEVGKVPIPLDFLPDSSIGTMDVTNAATQFRDSIALCCSNPGAIQLDLLRTAVEKVIKQDKKRDITCIRDRYKHELEMAGKKHDSILSRLNELTQMQIFSANSSFSEFFAGNWIISLKSIASEELKKLIILLILDSLKWNIMSQLDTEVVDGFRNLRHLLVIDESRRILSNKKYQSLSDLMRQGRSKGEVIMLLSQDPSDFDGQVDDFTTQLGTVIAFKCNQTSKGLRALQGAYGRRLQPEEFGENYLPDGVAFVKLPGREPERIRCW